MSRKTLLATAVVAGLAAAVTGWGAAAWGAAAEPTADEEAIARGRLTYRVYCANCHGRQAEGDGELAELLTVAPADLTRIRERYEGKFPDEWIARKIDGRERVRGHGMQEMPVWGLSFRDANRPADQEEEVQARIDQLVAFLRTIQKTPAGAAEP